MNSRVRPSFWRAYSKLDGRARTAVKRPYRIFEQDPGYPSLHFKKLGGYENIWSVRINEQHRAIGERHGEDIVRFWVGTHNEFDKLFG